MPGILLITTFLISVILYNLNLRTQDQLDLLHRQTETSYATLYTRETGRRRLAEKLYEVGLALSSTLDRQKILALILEHLETVVHYDRAALLLYHENELEIVAARGFPAHLQPTKIRILLDCTDKDDVFLTIHRTQQPLIVPDVSQQLNWTHVENLPQAKSWLGIPLIHDQQVIGMLSLVRETDNIYNQGDIIPATTFAVQAAVALQNANLYNKIEQFNKQLAYEIEQRTEAVLQLARLDQAKSDFINVASHELRTPLTTIKGYSQMLLHEAPISENDHYHTLVSGIFQGAVRLHEIVNNLLSVAKIDNQTLSLYIEPISLAQVLQRIHKKITTAIDKERCLTITLADLNQLPTIEGDLDNLTTAFSHIITNAIKYTPDGGTITISACPVPQRPSAPPTHIEIIITDTGIGIDPDVQELIFTKFYQTGEVSLHSSGKTKFKGGGPGLGLAIVQGIVEAHDGQVWADSPGCDETTYPGSQFHVVLPIKQTQA